MMTRKDALLRTIPLIRRLADISPHEYAVAVADAWDARLLTEAAINSDYILDDLAEQAMVELLEYGRSITSPDEAVDWIDLLARNALEMAEIWPNEQSVV
jgi:hypothetical protein